MKQVFIVLLILEGFIDESFSQDSLFFKKDSWSLTSGVNINYPSVNEYREVEGASGSNYYSDFIVKPKSSYNSYAHLAYSHVLYSNSFSSFSISPSIAYARSVHKYSEDGFYEGGFSGASFAGTIKHSEINDNIVLSFGLNSNIKLFLKGPVWSNQLGVGYDFTMHWKAIDNYNDHQNGNKTFEGHRWVLYSGDFVFYYQVGFSFRLTKRFYLSPGGRIPIVSISSYNLWNKNQDNSNLTSGNQQIYKNAVVSVTLILLMKK